MIHQTLHCTVCGRSGYTVWLGLGDREGGRQIRIVAGYSEKLQYNYDNGDDS